jgi:hypothetical protein
VLSSQRVKSICGLTAAVWLALWTGSAGADRQRRFQEELIPILRTYCFECHDGESEIPLEKDDSIEAMAKHRAQWIRALAQVQLGTMPPADSEPMDAASRKRLEELIDELANAVDCVRNPNAGRVAIRRLNRAEYRNTIRDLTGVDYRPADGFPGDDVGYGFDNIGDVLSLPTILMEKYLAASEEIMGQAIYTLPPPELFVLDKRADALIGAEKYGASPIVMGGTGTVSLQKDLPFSGNYRVIITARGDQGGDEPVKVRVQCGSQEKIIDVTGKEPAQYETSLRLGKGTKQIDFTFINDFYDAEKKIDRNLHLYHVQIQGEETRSTFISTGKKPPSHDQLIFETPMRRGDEDRATGVVMQRFASRAFRRPASKTEVSRLMELAQKVRQDGGTYEEGIQVSMQAVLVSPHFLFKVERPQTPDASGKMPSISDYEMATRLSYFLWSSMPDDELLLMAHRGQIRDRKRLLTKIASMIKDRRATRFVNNFAGQWLQLRSLDRVKPDTRIFRGFNDEIRDAMRRETLLFFASVMQENQPVTTLLSADYTFLNEPLAVYYGLNNVSGKEFRKVSLAGTPRGGLLTHASVLTVTSNPSRTSPVKRGKFILDNLLNMPPPPAPPNVPELEKGKLTGTLRQRMEQHRANPACATCHSMMDPMGFALENFDAVGRYRTVDGVDAINASGELPDGTQFTGADDLRRILSVERQEQFVRCLTEKMLIYAIGRGTEYYDKCAIDKVVADAKAQNYKFAYLIAGIVLSDPFQKQGIRE